MGTKIIKHNLPKEDFSNHNFRDEAANLSHRLYEDPNVKSHRYLGIDPYPRPGEYVEVWFVYEIETHEE